MSGSKQGAHNGLPKLIEQADGDESLGEILAQHEQYECPDCGWVADLHRTQCMVCDFDQRLQPVGER